MTASDDAGTSSSNGSPRRFLNGVITLMIKSRLILISAVLLVIVSLSVWPVIREPVEPPASPLVVNDVSQLNPIQVSGIVVPTTTAEIADAVIRHAGPISIGGARHSMGGQIATKGAFHIDMRQFNRILEFSPASRTITVEAGATWRQIQEQIDPANLSVKIMQSYANFTVGGSLSVNGHGRYVGFGPLIRAFKSVKVVLADGSIVEASPTDHTEIFNGVIGGYGGLGVITEATMELTDDVRVRRETKVMPITTYRPYFFDHIRARVSPVFHSANIFPGDYSSVRAVTFSRTNDPVTVADRLMPTDHSYRLNRLAFWIESEWPFGKLIQRSMVDPIYFAGEVVTWRNYEASRDVAELEPASRATSTYLLQEYFVPVERFDEFAAQMRRVLQTHDVNVVNVSIRHSMKDPGSLLAWARVEVFAFVIYYKQPTDPRAPTDAGVWTRELVDAALNVGGSYYLPYQLHATKEQFRRAYPRAAEFFALKQRLDPTNKFRNELLDKYYDPAATSVR
jgi:FAD/FMN-containing dehydrogenase